MNLTLQIVVVLDPDVAKEYLDKVQGRSKEKQYAFDMAFDYTNSNEVMAGFLPSLDLSTWTFRRKVGLIPLLSRDGWC